MRISKGGRITHHPLPSLKASMQMPLIRENQGKCKSSLVTTDCPTSFSASVRGLCCDGGDSIFPCSLDSDQVCALLFGYWNVIH